MTAPALPLLATASAGAAVMALEICGPRLLAPSFGSGTIVWAVLLCCVLLALSAGGLYGGRLADRQPSTRALGTCLLAGALLCALSAACASPLGRAASDAVPPTPGAQLAALFAAAAVLFGVPAACLAAAYPLALRAHLGSLERAGRTYGALQAASALGSVAGVLVPPLLAVPSIGTRATVMLFAVPAAVVGLLALRAPLAAAATAVAALALLRPAADALAWESSYAAYRIVDGPAGRLLCVDALPGDVSVPVYSVSGPKVTGHYFDAFVLAPSMASLSPRSVLIVGVAGGTAAHLARAAFPSASIVGVEIDATLIDHARASFALDASGITAAVADGRCFLRRSDARYDLIVLDATVGVTPPPHLVSAEFLRELRARLSPGGVLAANVVAPLDGAFAATAARVFPSVVKVENVTVASDVGLDPQRMSPEAARIGWPGLSARAARLIADAGPPPDLPALTDDRGAPPWWWGLRVEDARAR